MNTAGQDVHFDYFIVIQDTGIPLLTIKGKEHYNMDDILLSGFVVAVTEFASELMKSEKKALYFRHLDHDGIIKKLDKHFYCIIGKQLSKKPFEFFETLFNFIHQQYVLDSFQSSILNVDYLRELLSYVIHQKAYYDLIVPEKLNEINKTWDESAVQVLDLVDGYRNIQEIAFSLNMRKEVVYAIIIILSWLNVVKLTLKIRDYVVFKKNPLAVLNNEEGYNKFQSFTQKESVFAILKLIDNKTTVAQLKTQLPNIDVERYLLQLLEDDLIRPLGADHILQLIGIDYLRMILEQLDKTLKKNEKEEIINAVFLETEYTMFYQFSKDYRLDPLVISESIKDMLELGFSYEEIIAQFMKPIKLLHKKLKAKRPSLGTKVFGAVFEKIINKHKFALERMGLLGLLCDETLLE